MKSITITLLLIFCMIVTSCTFVNRDRTTNGTPLSLIPSELPTIKEFLRGLRENDATALRSVVVKDSWPKIDSWTHQHTSVTCPANWSLLDYFDSDEGPFTASASYSYDNPGLWKGSATDWTRCDTEKGYALYTISVTTVTLVYSDTQWLVSDWEDVREKR